MTNLDRLAEMWADLDPVDDWRPHIRDAIEEITRLRAAPSVPSGGPVAWIYQNSNTEREYLVWQKGTGGRNWQPLYATPQPAPAASVPVATVGDLIIQVRERVMAAGIKNNAPLYAAPAAPGGGAGPNA
jgi:hypothetical protein